MKTHELAQALTQLASILKAAPNVELSAFRSLVSTSRKRTDHADAALSLTGLLALSKISKAEWRDLIQRWELPVEIPNTYSARDTIGKLLQYLSDNPIAREKIRKQSEVKASPELMRALSVIMGGAGK